MSLESQLEEQSDARNTVSYDWYNTKAIQRKRAAALSSLHEFDGHPYTQER